MPKNERVSQEFRVQIEGLELTAEQVKEIDTALQTTVLKVLASFDQPPAYAVIPEEGVGVKAIFGIDVGLI